MTAETDFPNRLLCAADVGRYFQVRDGEIWRLHGVADDMGAPPEPEPAFKFYFVRACDGIGYRVYNSAGNAGAGYEEFDLVAVASPEQILDSECKKISPWLSAALNDEKSCAKFKEDIERFLAAVAQKRGA